MLLAIVPPMCPCLLYTIPCANHFVSFYRGLLVISLVASEIVKAGGKVLGPLRLASLCPFARSMVRFVYNVDYLLSLTLWGPQLIPVTVKTGGIQELSVSQNRNKKKIPWETTLGGELSLIPADIPVNSDRNSLSFIKKYNCWEASNNYDDFPVNFLYSLNNAS